MCKEDLGEGLMKKYEVEAWCPYSYSEGYIEVLASSKEEAKKEVEKRGYVPGKIVNEV